MSNKVGQEADLLREVALAYERVQAARAADEREAKDALYDAIVKAAWLHTYQEIGCLLDLTPQRVQQIVNEKVTVSGAFWKDTEQRLRDAMDERDRQQR